MDWLFNWLQSFVAWVWQLVKDVFGFLWTFVTDAMLWAFEGILQAVLAVLQAIPVPSFLSGYSLGTLFASLPGEVGFFVGKLHMPEAIALVGAGASFLLLRKLVTLGQW